MRTTLSASLLYCTALLFLLLSGCNPSEPAANTASSAEVPATSSPSSPEVGTADAAIAEAVAHSLDPFERARRLGELLPTLGSDAIPAVTQLLRNFRLDLGSVEFDLLLRFWALQEPQEAATWAFDSGPPLYRTNALRTTIEILAQNDPPAAVAIVGKAVLESDEITRVSQIALVRGWFLRDRDQLMEYIQGLGTGVPRQRSLYAYALALAGVEGADAVKVWAEAYPEDDERFKRAIYQQSMSALVWSNEAAASRFCEAHCDGPYGRGMREVLIRHRLQRGDDGATVLEWVQNTAPETDRKSHSIWVAYVTWAFRNPEAATGWMRQQIESGTVTWQKQLYGEYARQLAAEDPEGAMQIAEQLEDVVDRERTVIRIARHWLKVDAEAAERWLAASEQDERVLESIRNPRGPNYLPRVER